MRTEGLRHQDEVRHCLGIAVRQAVTMQQLLPLAHYTAYWLLRMKILIGALY